MRLLLDTQVALWALEMPEKISSAGLALIGDPENEIYVSVVSIWEIAIKRALGRRSAPDISAGVTVRYFASAGYETLDMTAAHAVAVETLPLLHGDPFDRLLVAQALTEPMRLLTHDATLPKYGPIIERV